MTEERRMDITSIIQKHRIATMEEYAEWMREYISNGGKIGYHYDGDYRGNIVIPEETPFVIPSGAYGSWSFEVIVPSGFEIIDNGNNHVECYYLNNSKNFPDMYRDVAIELGISNEHESEIIHRKEMRRIEEEEREAKRKLENEADHNEYISTVKQLRASGQYRLAMKNKKKTIKKSLSKGKK